ncbi:MAG: NAD(P)-dependent alcohol dehydrogenase [Kordiimonas sp.]
MKAMVYERYGPPEVLELKDVPKPTPKDDEVLIKVHAAAVTMGDCELRSGKMDSLLWIIIRIMFGFFKPKYRILGQELAGDVEAVGAEVKRFRAGDKVFACTDQKMGADAEYISLSLDRAIAKKPEKLSYAEAASSPVGWTNALHFLKLAKLKKGESVLVVGGSGLIGIYAIQLARYMGAEVTAVGNHKSLELMKKLGATHVIDYEQENYWQNGETYDVVFEAVGKSPFGKALKTTAKNGRLIIANPQINQLLRVAPINKLTSKRVIWQFASDTSEDLEYLCELIEAGEIQTVIDKHYKLEELIEAHKYIETGLKTGGVILDVISNG